MNAALQSETTRSNGPLYYHDAKFDTPAVKLLPADFFVTDSDLVLVTVLGSCVAACLHDAQAGIGGMNHFLLPDGDSSGAPARYGSYAMELLINAMLKAGARRERLQAKVFGGGNVLKGFTSNPVGTRNAQFVTDYLAAERIPILARDLMGIHPRKIWLFPHSGKVIVHRLPHAHDVEVRREEFVYKAQLDKKPIVGDVELFS